MEPGSRTSALYERMRASVLSLELMPGERLTERGLESRFGASRTPARAALMRLETEGLVQREGRGWIVSPIDPAEIRALAELREAVECKAVRLAVERADSADIDSVIELLESAIPLASEDEGVRAGGDFHVELARLSGNAFLVDAVKGAMTRLARTRWLEVRTIEAREQAWNEHRAIVQAIQDGDADIASQLTAQHVHGTNERLLTFLSAERLRLRAHGLSVVPGPEASE